MALVAGDPLEVSTRHLRDAEIILQVRVMHGRVVLGVDDRLMPVLREEERRAETCGAIADDDYLGHIHPLCQHLRVSPARHTHMLWNAITQSERRYQLMSPIPRAPGFDNSIALLSEGYSFAPRRARRYGSDIFETRVMLRKAFFVTGEDAARQFYEPGRFTRRHALPATSLKLLLDKGSVSVVDGDDHRWRKDMFMSLMAPERIAHLADGIANHWQAQMSTWEAADSVVLFDETRAVLCRAVCEWAGVPLGQSEIPQRTRELGAMISGAGTVGPRNWWGMLLRARTERWAKNCIENVRSGEFEPPEGSALAVIAQHRGRDGEPLDTAVAAVELINILRPTVAVAYFITFAALALHHHPECVTRIETEDDYVHLFVQEVRRFFPFFPMVGGRVRQAFDWRGQHFGKGTWFILDIYGTNHDARIWDEPEVFRPERFRQWDGSAFNFIPQGGGDFYSGHRCAGEWITIRIMETAVRLLAMSMRYEVPEQDLRVNLARMPTLPNSRFVISNVRSTSG